MAPTLVQNGWALAQDVGEGAGGGGGGGGVDEQEIFAAQPGLLIIPSEVKIIVIQFGIF